MPKQEGIRYCQTTLNSSERTLYTLFSLQWRGFDNNAIKPTHPELVCKYPTHLVPHVKVQLEKVRYSRTAPNSCERTLHALLALQWSCSRRFDDIEPTRTSAQGPYTPCSPCEGVVREVREGLVLSNHSELI